MKYLLDTCAISESTSKQPQIKVLSFLDSLEPDDTYLSVITCGELSRGIDKLAPSKRKIALSKWLKDDLLTRFDGNILVPTLDVMLFWGEMIGRLERKGIVLSPFDSLIAAQALHGDFVIVTRNQSDFQQTGVKLVNPWL